MVKWLTRILLRPQSHEEGQRASVLHPDEIPRDEEDITWFGLEATILITRKRILLTDPKHTRDFLSIPLCDVLHLEPSAERIRLRYRAPDGREDIEAFRFRHCGVDPELDQLDGWSHRNWVESVAEVILEETRHFVLDEEDDI